MSNDAGCLPPLVRAQRCLISDRVDTTDVAIAAVNPQLVQELLETVVGVAGALCLQK